MARAKELIVRAWDLRPTWRENASLLGAGALMVWLLGASWWLVPIAYAIAVPPFTLLLGWLELHNEAADREEAARRETDAGESGAD